MRYLAGLLCVLLGLMLGANECDAAVMIKRLAYRDPGVPTIVVANTVDQAAMDTLMTACGTGCNLFFDRDVDFAATITLDGDQSAMVGLVGPLRGRKPVLKAPILSSVAATLADSNDCAGAFDGEFQCQDEDYKPVICVTLLTDLSPAFRNAECGGDADGVNGGIRFLNFTIDGQKEDQPAPRPENCIDLEDNGTGTCTHTKQHLFLVQDGDDHIVQGVTLTEGSHVGFQAENTDSLLFDANTVSKIGCHNVHTGQDADGDCGDDWAAVPTAFNLRLGNANGRQSNGSGVVDSAYSTNNVYSNNAVGYGTKTSMEMSSSTTGCAAATGKDATFDNNTLGSQVSVDGACRATVTNNAIKSVFVGGEEALDVAHGITLENEATGPHTIKFNTIKDTQGEGIKLVLLTEADTTLVSDNSVTDACQAYNPAICAGIDIRTETGLTDLDVLYNAVNAGNGKIDVGFYLTEAIAATPGADALFAFNRVWGGTGSQLKHAILISEMAGFDLRANVLDWDTDISVSAIEIDSVTGGGHVQADAFNDLADTGVGYTGTGASVHVSEVGGISEGTDYHDCDLGIDAGTADAGCYDTFTIAYTPDTQHQYGAIRLTVTLAQIDVGYFDEQIQWLLDSRECFHTGKTAGGANPANSECFNIKFVAGVGDIVTGRFDGEPDGQYMANMSLIYQRLGTAHKGMAIPFLGAIGNHDFDGGSQASNDVTATQYQEFFSKSIYQTFTGWTDLKSSLATDIVISQYDDGTDLAHALRFKALDRWWMATTTPYHATAQPTDDFRTLLYDWVDDFQNDFVYHFEHAVSSGMLSTGICSTDTGFPHQDDTLTANRSLLSPVNQAYQQFYAASGGHFTESNPEGAGFFCRQEDLNADGDAFLWNSANWQNGFSLNIAPCDVCNDDWVVLVKHDVGADTITGQAFSTFADDGAGGFAHNEGFGATPNESAEPSANAYLWTVSLDLSTR